MLDFKYPPLRTGNVMMCYKKRHPLPLKYFITFLGSIRKVGEASHITYLDAPRSCPHQVIFARIYFQISYNMPNLGYPLSIGNGILCSKLDTHCC